MTELFNNFLLTCLLQGADLAIKFLGQEKASRVVEIVSPRLTEMRRFSAVSTLNLPYQHNFL